VFLLFFGTKLLQIVTNSQDNTIAEYLLLKTAMNQRQSQNQIFFKKCKKCNIVFKMTL